MRRSALLAVPLSVAALAIPTWAVAQPAPGTTTSGTDPAAGSTTPTTTRPAYKGPPRISTIRLRKVVKSQQGHARFMLGVTTRGPITLTVTITNRKDKEVVRTFTSPKEQAQGQGQVWMLVQAVNDEGYQLPTGNYRVAIKGKDSRGRTTKTLRRNFKLQLTPPRGRIDGLTVPNLPAIARQMRIAPGGQLVTALKPRGILVTAGLRRGDVIIKVNGLEVNTPGQWSAALKALPADTPVPIEYRRGAEVRTGTIDVPPDWNPAPDYAKTFKVLLKRSPRNLGYLLASGRNLVDTGKADDAQAQFDKWPKGLQMTAVGQMLQGEILLAKDDLDGAREAFTAATTKDPTLAPALLSLGLVLSRQDRTEEAVPVFQAAVTADPGNAIAQAFLAYALVATDQNDAAIAAATEASRLDRFYEDGPIALGLALIASGDKARGVAQLKKGLMFMADQQRADKLIAESIEPNV